MICEHCKQRHATVTVTQVQNGQKFERQYCEVCATKFHPFQFEKQEETVSLHQLLSNWFNLPVAKQIKEGKVAGDKANSSCPNCGCTYRQFLKQGKFGCADCYETFTDQLSTILKRLQAGTEHIGFKVAQQDTAQYLQQIEELRDEQKHAVEKERFEEAAEIRDKIRALASKVEARGEGHV